MTRPYSQAFRACLAKLLAVLALAFAFAHATGQWRAKYRQIVIRTHTRISDQVQMEHVANADDHVETGRWSVTSQTTEAR